MVTKKVSTPASVAGLVNTAMAATATNVAVAPAPTKRVINVAVKPVAVKPAAPAPAPVKVAPVKVAARKKSIQTVQNGLSSRKETDKTTPYVLIRKPVSRFAKPTRQIVQFIEVNDTQEPHHVRSMRVCVVDGYTFGTNLNQVGNDLRKARVFAYSTVTTHGKTSKTVQPWDSGNNTAVKALQMLGFITQYELEYHLGETKIRKSDFEAAAAAKAKAKQRADELKALTANIRALVKTHGISSVTATVRQAGISTQFATAATK